VDDALPEPHNESGGEIEIRQVFEAEDFEQVGPAKYSDVLD